MKYLINKDSLSEQQVLYIENLERGLITFLQKKINDYPNLTILPKWEVKERNGEFINMEHNASFALDGSFAVYNAVESFLNKKVNIELSDCSLFLNLTFNKKEIKDQEKEIKNRTYRF